MLKWGVLAVAIIASSFFVGLRWDVEGVAIAYAIAAFLLSFPGTYISCRIIKLRMWLFFRNFILTGAASFVMAAAVFMCRYYLKHTLQASDIIVLLLCTAVGVISYLGLLAIWGRSLLKEIRGLIVQARAQGI